MANDNEVQPWEKAVTRRVLQKLRESGKLKVEPKPVLLTCRCGAHFLGVPDAEKPALCPRCSGVLGGMVR